MSTLKLIALCIAAVGFGFAVFGMAKYSDFLARLQKLSPGETESLALESTENWSSKNWAIGIYFWKRKYLGQDVALNALGNSVRYCNLAAVALVGVAAVIILIGGSGV